MTIDIIFYIGFSFLVIHEMDAVKRHEWRIFPGLSNLKEDTAYYVFTILHIPLLVLLLWFLAHPFATVRHWFQIGMDIFFIVHMGLHHFFKTHTKYEFDKIFSRAIIYLMALSGLVHILLFIMVKS